MSGPVLPSTLVSTLVLGGARSGKSLYAERLVRESGLTPLYLATATAGDDEMGARITLHRERRGDDWLTIEEVECLTLWLSNLLFAERDLAVETAALCTALARLDGVVLVSNEIGMGLVPDNALGRRFRDAQGRLNQAVAAIVPSVVFVAAGLPLALKSPKDPA
jgi:adenosylcobinamide kinase/adenosylcobinamide-phosphate guanylyltransferase